MEENTSCRANQPEKVADLTPEKLGVIFGVESKSQAKPVHVPVRMGESPFAGRCSSGSGGRCRGFRLVPD